MPEFGGLSGKQLPMVTAILLCKWLQFLDPMAQCDAKSLLQSACNSGIACLDEQKLAIVTAQLVCEILQAGGGGGGSCIVCGDTDPVADPDCDCAFGYNRLTGAEFIWDDTFGIWRQTGGGP